MKKILALILCLSAAATTLCACGDATQLSDGDTLSNDYTRGITATDSYNYDDGATDAPTVYNTYSSEITDFELKLFRNYYKQNTPKGSFVISPVNSTLQLASLANGASGDSQTEILLALGSDLTLDNVNQCSSYFKSRLLAVSKIADNEKNELGECSQNTTTSYVKLDNSIFVNDTSDIKKSFLQTNANYISNNVFRFMFSDENALKKVNNHFTDYTDSQALTSLDSNSKMIAVSAADICDTWLTSYAESDKSTDTFKATSGDKDVTYLQSNESGLKTDYAQGVVKYTNATPLKFMLVMPNEGTSLADYISDFTNLEFSNLLDSADIKEKTTTKIPEFSIDSQGSATSMKDSVEKSGLFTLFTDSAKFTDMTYSDDFVLNDLCEITPKVTFNAAGLGGQSSNGDKALVTERTTALETSEYTIEFNRPFMFLILDNESNIPLYIGTVDF